jgi:hypothetical protein
VAFPFGLEGLSLGELKQFRKLYEDSVRNQPVDDFGKWFLETYNIIAAGEFTEALNRLDLVLGRSPDYTGFIASKHVLSQAQSGSFVSYQVARRLLAHRSPLLFRYGLCLVIAGEVPVNHEIASAVQRQHSGDPETLTLFQIAEIAIKNGVAPHV